MASLFEKAHLQTGTYDPVGHTLCESSHHLVTASLSGGSLVVSHPIIKHPTTYQLALLHKLTLLAHLPVGNNALPTYYLPVVIPYWYPVHVFNTSQHLLVY